MCGWSGGVSISLSDLCVSALVLFHSMVSSISFNYFKLKCFIRTWSVCVHYCLFLKCALTFFTLNLPSSCNRLAMVWLGSGLGVMCPNLNLHLTVWFRHLPNMNMDKRFGFNRFSSGSNPVWHKKSQLYLQISNTVGQKMLVKRFPTRQLQNRDLSPSKPHLQPEVDHHGMLGPFSSFPRSISLPVRIS